MGQISQTDPTRVIALVSPPENKVHDYLLKTDTYNQTLESVDQFLKSCEKCELAKAEKLNIINIRPSTQVETDPEAFEELVELIANLFPPTPKPEGADEDEEGISDVKEGTNGLTDDTDEDKEGTDGFTRDDAGEDKEGFADGLLPEDTDEVIEGTTYGYTGQ
ncbi:hypothetical protein C5167_014631 [Papaver somniferum]|uniref:Uncharacterized protein n=1 Tax=Papaver somniferum TaxID=3469 RepID=A0A4Y7J7N1_PAPSO|nr:hypothetical protein C5167_014631 [Papaver somniferum]